MQKLKFTGERMIPEINIGASYFYEHLARYFFSCQFVKDNIVLDAGCGVGYGSHLLSSYGKAKKIIAVDISPEAIDYAKSKYKDKNIVFDRKNLEDLKGIGDGSVNVIVCFEAIEHLKLPEKMLSEFSRILVSNGIIVFSTPNKLTSPKTNQYHYKEYIPEEFLILLKKYFKFVKIFQQTLKFAQHIHEESLSKIKLEEELFISKDFTYTPITNVNDCQYLIAICSNNLQPEIVNTCLMSQQLDVFDIKKGIVPLVRFYNKIQKKINNLKFQNINYQRQINELQNELDALKKSKVIRARNSYHKIKNFLSI